MKVNSCFRIFTALASPEVEIANRGLDRAAFHGAKSISAAGEICVAGFAALGTSTAKRKSRVITRWSTASV
jgi:hypothetical protein